MREKVQVLSEFWIKVIALLTMTLDHVGMFLMFYNASTTALYTTGFVFRIFGRIAFPLFAFMLAEGLRHTKKRGDYVFRLFILWAVIALADVIMYSIYRAGGTGFLAGMGSSLSGQAFSDLLALALFIYLLENKNKKLKPLCLLPIVWIVCSYVCSIADKYGAKTFNYFPSFLRTDYSVFGLLIFLGFYYAYPIAERFIKGTLPALGTNMEEYRKTKEYRSLVNVAGISIFFVVTVIFWGISYIDFRLDPFETPQTRIQNYCLLACFILLLYNGKRGYSKKWFQYSSYVYYPVHLAIIGLIFSLIYG